MVFFAVNELHLDFDTALYKESASRLMLMLNQYDLVNIGEDGMMTLSDIELIENRGKNGRRKRTTED